MDEIRINRKELRNIVRAVIKEQSELKKPDFLYNPFGDTRRFRVKQTQDDNDLLLILRNFEPSKWFTVHDVYRDYNKHGNTGTQYLFYDNGKPVATFFIEKTQGQIIYFKRFSILGEENRGRGYFVEALKHIIEYLIDYDVVVTPHVKNEKVKNILRRLNFRFEGDVISVRDRSHLHLYIHERGTGYNE